CIPFYNLPVCFLEKVANCSRLKALPALLKMYWIYWQQQYRGEAKYLLIFFQKGDSIFLDLQYELPAIKTSVLH
ncbi:MAG TPA: hypothetical protein PLA14_02280, partial [Ferruginibacter sp.]|nr:hypothetical protein [Ferruginibacter sp.]